MENRFEIPEDFPWRWMHRQYSGRYTYTEDIWRGPTVHLTLHIDIDGMDPLKVVSGTVFTKDPRGLPRKKHHFIGRVILNEVTNEGRRLEVEGFQLNWPEIQVSINHIEIQLTPTLPSFETPSAEVTFITDRGRRYGPYTMIQESIYFREVEVEVDREDGAIDPEPYNTHTHPIRPAGLEEYDLRLETAYQRAGIKITRRIGGVSILDSSEAGEDEKWTYEELHNSMEEYWSAFTNRPQWKMWVFLAEEATNSGLLGVMFDGYIDEPGGVDRQGAAIFTKCPGLENLYAPENPPEAEAIQRMNFFNLIHEPGHCFNLFHPFQKTLLTPWDAPPWMPMADRDLALTWMNYSWRATSVAEPGSTWLNDEWFFERFRFRFDKYDNFFLRHAPERFVIMGGEAWGVNHGLVLQSSLDPRLELLVRSRKKIFELGEPMTVELRLKNVSDEHVTIHENFDLYNGPLELAITDPDGKRKPFLPFVHADSPIKPRVLNSGEAIYLPVNLTIGLCGCPFKKPGAYRIEVGYHNFGGSTAAAAMQIYVRPPANFDDMPVIDELFNARVGRVLYIGGSRTMQDVDDKLKWVSGKLGKKHPAQFHFTQALSSVFAHPFKVVEPEKKKVRLLDADPDYVEAQLKTVVTKPDAAADSLGHIGYEQLVDTYVSCAVKVRKKPAARTAMESMVSLFEDRKVLPPVINKAKQQLKKLK